MALVLVALALAKRVEGTPIIWWVSNGLRALAERRYREDNAEMLSLRRQVVALSTRVGEVSDRDEEIALRDEYLDVVTEWSRRLREWAGDRGYGPPPPPLTVFSQWRRGRGRKSHDET